MSKWVEKTAITVAVLGCLAASPPLLAQTPWTGYDFGDLEQRADEVVDVTLDASMISLAAAFMSDDEDDAELKSLLSRLEGIYVKSFGFDRDGEYDRVLVDDILARVPADFKPIVTVSSRDGEDIRILARPGGSGVYGLLILAAEPDGLTLVEIDGAIDVDDLSKLDGHLGIPRLDLEDGSRQGAGR